MMAAQLEPGWLARDMERATAAVRAERIADLRRRARLYRFDAATAIANAERIERTAAELEALA